LYKERKRERKNWKIEKWKNEGMKKRTNENKIKNEGRKEGRQEGKKGRSWYLSGGFTVTDN
jgi:hypothetical protein